MNAFTSELAEKEVQAGRGGHGIHGVGGWMRRGEKRGTCTKPPKKKPAASNAPPAGA